jgi:hypothetical protein
MRTPNIGSIQYQPEPVPDNPADLPRYLLTEFDRLASVVRLLAAGHLDVTHVAPPKPRQGDLRYADGTDWDPGSGEGWYFYNSSGIWKFLG